MIFGAILGLRYVVENGAALLKGETRALLPAYVAGVDAFIDQGGGPARRPPLCEPDPSLV